jgi:hypothetical protein
MIQKTEKDFLVESLPAHKKILPTTDEQSQANIKEKKG